MSYISPQGNHIDVSKSARIAGLPRGSQAPVIDFQRVVHLEAQQGLLSMVRFAVRVSFATLFFGLWVPAYAGTSDPIGIAGLIFTVIVGGILLFALGTVVAVGLLFKGKFRIPAVCVIVLFWGGLYQVKVAMPIKASKEETSFRTAAWKQCESDLASLEASYPVDGVLDEAASLRKRQVLQLLSERKLNFIEFKVQQFESGHPRIAYADGEGENSWEVKRPVGSFVRIELGKVDDPACDTDLVYGVKGRTQKPPFLPDTCLKTSFPEAPTARYAITHKLGGHTANAKFNAWQLVDRQQNKVLAQLTTVEQPERASPARDLSRFPDRSLSDCRSPHTLLADRLVGIDQSIVGHPQLVSITTVIARVPPKSLDLKVSSAPKVQATAELTALDEEADRQISHPYIAKQGWINAVDQAKRTGWGTYGPQLLDWKNRQLITLQLMEGNAYPWASSSGDDGFWVRSTGTNWYQRPDNLIARYSANGQFLWMASIVGTEVEVLPEGCEMIPYAMAFDARFVSLHKPCRNVKSTREGLAWRIKRTDLPKNVLQIIPSPS